ncbi:MAG: phosphoribosylformylglycinamidine synthase I [Planctomycetes bacterium]|nr:phosphoribosylformylglycinamidine synthase I [Planctomycetota bacterium]
MTVKVCIPRAPGTNCDRELEYAFERAGAQVELVPLARLFETKEPFGSAGIVAFPGGFSYGDDVASGKIFAVEVQARLQDSLLRFLDRGGLSIGICNGFQVLAKAGILPGFTPGKQEATLAHNASGRFEGRWVTLEALACRAEFIPAGARIPMPSAHGEGQFLAFDDATLRRIVDEKLVAFRYVTRDGEAPAPYPDNPNGSVLGIAGICDPRGRVMGMMPHPERNIAFHHDPEWTRRSRSEEGAGMVIFRRLVEQARRGE